MKRLLTSGTLVVATLFGGGAGMAEPAISAAELSGFKTRLEKVRGEYDKWRREVERELKDAEAVKIRMVRKDSRPRQLSYLRFLTMLEEDLRLLTAPEDEVNDELEVPEFGVQERRRVAETPPSRRLAMAFVASRPSVIPSDARAWTRTLPSVSAARSATADT